MKNLNKVQLIGRLGSDPQVKVMGSGQNVVNVNLGSSESYKDKNGQRVERTEWVRLVAFGRQADFMADFLGRGRLVYVEGKLQTRKFTDGQGQDRWITEVLVRDIGPLDPKPAGARQSQAYDAPPCPPEGGPDGGYGGGYPDEPLDDVPF